MAIQIDATSLTCKFCEENGRRSSLVRSMHGIYCTNDECYSRLAQGNLVPPVPCERCKENAFYYEEPKTLFGVYMCAACGHKMNTE